MQFLRIVATFASTVALVAPQVARGATTATGAHGAVATDQRLASETGLRVLRAGGNAVDAAIAIGYTLAATFPAAGNLGGGGFMLVRLANGASHFIDFREVAPAAATADMYLDTAGAIVPGRSVVGPLAAGVPGTVAGLEYARVTYGTLPRHELLRDAIDAAERGFALTAADARVLHDEAPALAQFPATAAIFAPNGTTLPAGAILRQPDLARTLRRIDAAGADGFYRGDVAHDLSSAVRTAGGIMTEADLAAYRVVDRTPLSCRYRDATIITAPLPSSGGVTMCEIAGILANERPVRPVRRFENAHLELEAERRAFVDRNTQLGDPAFVASPVGRLLDPAYLARSRASIAPVRATPSTALHGGAVVSHEGHNTTNYSVVDGAGDAVDVTYTLNNSFGSDYVAGSTGVLLNDEMDDFTTKIGTPNMFGLVQGAANAIAPGKRPLSSMTPSMVVDASGRLVFVTGAAGGPRIITTTFDTIRAVVDFHEEADTALADPRAHMQWLPDVVYAEPDTFDAATRKRLRAAGYRLSLGRIETAANAAAVRPDGTRVGAHDPRIDTGSTLAY